MSSFEHKHTKFDLQKIAIVYSHMARPSSIYEQQGKLSFDIKISQEHDEEQKLVFVSLLVTSHDKGEEDKKLELKIKAEATFAILNISEDKGLALDYFTNVNAPAIIYPYIRQHATYLSLQAGTINPIILPILNFVDLYDNQKKETP
ncbi:MAG: hypothetical protein DHS20C18_55690 [Saprospiraceae bacterium]|nr:MAG: hypothetical protein DHS20C18_55690 [Saprospiraceae bacterium]